MMRTMVQWGLAGLMAFAVHVPVRADGSSATTATSHLEAATATGDIKTSDVSVVASNLPLARVLQQLENQSGIPIHIMGSAADTKVTIIVPKPRPLDQVLEQLSQSNDLKIRKSEAGYEFWDTTEYQEQAREVRIYQISQASARDINRLITPLLSDASGKLVREDDRLNTLLVYDVPENHRMVAEIIEKVDQPQPSRVFLIRHRRVSEMEIMLKTVLRLDQTQLWADDATRQVMVSGNSVQIANAEHLLKTFDIPVSTPTPRPSQPVSLQR